MASYIGQLRPANPDETAAIKAAASESGAPGIVSAALEAAKKGLAPGSERWSVKTGADANVGQVGKVIVDTTVRELGHFKRPNQLLPATDPHTAVPRASPVETTVWRVTAHVIALKLETDGDFHLVLQHDSGSNLIAEIPLPKPNFVPKTSPFFDDIVKARDAAQKHFEPKVAATQFSPITDPITGQTKLVPRHALQQSGAELTAAAAPPVEVDLTAALAAPEGALEFAMRIDPTPATITGVGFFDKDHGATGAAPNVVELHPVLDLTFGV